MRSRFIFALHVGDSSFANGISIAILDIIKYTSYRPNLFLFCAIADAGRRALFLALCIRALCTGRQLLVAGVVVAAFAPATVVTTVTKVVNKLELELELFRRLLRRFDVVDIV